VNYSALTDGASEGVSPLLILKTVEGLIPPGGFTPPSTPIPAYRDSEIPSTSVRMFIPTFFFQCLPCYLAVYPPPASDLLARGGIPTLLQAV